MLMRKFEGQAYAFNVRKIEVAEFNPDFKATPKNVQWICDISPTPYLVSKFNLSGNDSFPVQISISDVSHYEIVKGSENAKILVDLEDCPDDWGRNLDLPIDINSPIISLFTPEYVKKIFGGVGLRKSQYSELLQMLQKKDIKLIFDAILDYKTWSEEQRVFKKITVSAMIPNCNNLLRYLVEENIV